jgi:hypothetical protein
MTRPRFAATAIALASLLVASAAVAQLAPDDLVITGAGFGHGWDTEIELADSPSGTGTSGTLRIETALAGPCPPICSVVPYAVRERGTVRILMSQAFPAFSGLLTLHVSTDTEQPLPIVRARIFNGAQPGQSADVPVLRNPTLGPRNFSVLVFPGLARSQGTYSNLVLQNLDPSVATEALVEAFGPDGSPLGSETVFLPREPFGAVVLVDVAGRLGASSVDGGSVRVTRQSGQQPLWGVLDTIYADGRLSVVSGANP